MYNSITTHCYIALCAHHPESPFLTISLTPFIFFILLLPSFLSGDHHITIFVCVCEFCLLLSIFYSKNEWNHMVLVLFLSDLFHLAWHSQDPSLLYQMSKCHPFYGGVVLHCVMSIYYPIVYFIIVLCECAYIVCSLLWRRTLNASIENITERFCSCFCKITITITITIITFI